MTKYNETITSAYVKMQEKAAAKAQEMISEEVEDTPKKFSYKEDLAEAYVRMKEKSSPITESTITESSEEALDKLEDTVHHLRKSGYVYEFPTEPWSSRGEYARTDLVPSKAKKHANSGASGKIGIMYNHSTGEAQVTHRDNGTSTKHDLDSIIAHVNSMKKSPVDKE